MGSPNKKVLCLSSLGRRACAQERRECANARTRYIYEFLPMQPPTKRGGQNGWDPPPNSLLVPILTNPSNDGSAYGSAIASPLTIGNTIVTLAALPFEKG